MIAASTHPLQSLKALLADAVRREDSGLLAECLAGRRLPALGGDQHPAEILYQALVLPPVDPRLGEGVTRLLTSLSHFQAAALEERLELLKQASETSQAVVSGTTAPEPPLGEETFLFNLLLLASLLPVDSALFAALRAFLEEGLRPAAFLTGMGRAARQLRQALIVHQVDDSLEEFWFALISEPKSAPRLVNEWKADLLDAWAGLLWIPPSSEDRDAGRSPNIDRIVRGLNKLYAAVDGATDGLSIIRYALRHLDEAYPRSPEYWADRLLDRFAEWPQLIQDLVVERWPVLEGDEVEGAFADAQAQEVWKLLAVEEREGILDLARKHDSSAWQAHWKKLIFKIPPPGLPRQSWAGGLQSIRRGLETRHSALRSAPATLTTPEDREKITPAVRGRRGRVDRLAAFDRVNRVIAAIEKKLEAGDLHSARRFLDDLVRDQEGSETEPRLIAKTLCNVAASAVAAGEYEWAELLYEDARLLAIDDPFPRTGFAEALKVQERFAEAETLYREITAQFPDNVVACSGLADVLKAQERFAEAEALYREITARFTNDVVPRNGLADVLKAQERFAEAEALYRETNAQFPNDVVARNGLAEILKSQGHLVEAETLYRETNAQFPNNVFARNGLAEVLKAQERFEEAEALYRETNAQFPHDIVGKNGLADVLKAQESFAEAEALYRETSAQFPNNVFARNGLAEVLKAQERFAEAEALYRETNAQFPNDVVAWTGLAEVLKAEERFAEAEALYRAISAQFPNNVFARNGWADVLKAQERLAEAETLYRETNARFPNDVVSRNGLAEVLKAQERFAEAEALYRATSAQSSNNVFARTGLAEVLKAQERFAEAEVLYREASVQFPNNVFTWTGLADVLKAQERFAEAEALYRETQAQFPNDVVAPSGLAEVLKAQERFTEAEALYRETTAKFPNDVVARNGLAEVLKSQERLTEAADLYRDTIDRFPKDRVARHGLANVMRKLGNFSEALLFVPEPAELRGLQDYYDLHLRGMIFLARGDVSSSVDTFRRGLQGRLPRRSEQYFRGGLAIAHLRQGRFLEAQRELAAAPDATPEVDALRLHVKAGLGEMGEAKQIYDEVSASILRFRRPTARAVEAISDAWGLRPELQPRQPTSTEIDAVIASEIEMLIAA